MKSLTVRSATSQRTRVFVQSQSTGLGVTGLAYNTTGLSVYYHRAGDTTSTAVTLSAGTVGTWSSGGWVAVDATNMPGLYEFGCPNAMWTSGRPILQVNVPSGSFCQPAEFELTGPDFTATSGTANALLVFGTGSGQVNASGKVPATVATNDGADSATLVSLLTPQRATNLDKLDAAISSRLPTTGYTVPPTAAAIRAEIDANSTKLDTAISTRAPLSTALSTSVWTNSKAGYLDAAVSGLATATSITTLATAVAQLPIRSEVAVTGDLAAPVDIAGAVFDYTVNGESYRKITRTVRAFAAGKVTPNPLLGTTQFFLPDGITEAFHASYDAIGNRTNVVIAGAN